MIRLIKENKIILLILLLALVMRLVAINQSLWLDEAIGAEVVKEQSFKEILTKFPKSDNHPPFYYLTLKAWTNLFGYSELSLRFPSIIFGVGTVWYLYLIGWKIAKKINRKRGITDWRFPEVTALLLATSPFHIYYSQEARMYVMAGFFASLAVYSYIVLVEELGNTRDKPLYWLLFSLSITALIFTDYVPVFLFPIFWIYACYKKVDKGWWSKFLLSHLLLIILGFAWMPLFLHQIERGRWLLGTLPAWHQVAGGATFKQAALVWMKFVLGRISFKDKVFYYSLVILSSIPFIVAGRKAWFHKKNIEIFWMWLIIPLIFGFLASFFFPAFIYFRFTYVIPAFYLIVSWGAGQFKNFVKKVLILSILFVNVVGWMIYTSEPYQQREQWRQAVDFVENKAEKNDVVIFEFSKPFAPYKWYSKGEVEAVGGTDSISANKDKTLQKTKKAVENKKGIYYFEYLRDLSDPDRFVEKAIDESGFKVENIYDFFPGIGQITYFKKAQ